MSSFWRDLHCRFTLKNLLSVAQLKQIHKFESLITQPSACIADDTAPYDPIWPLLAPLALLAKFGPIRHFLAIFGHI